MHIFLTRRLKILLFMTQFSITKPGNNKALKSIRVVKIKINQRPNKQQRVIKCKVLDIRVLPLPSAGGG